MEHQTVVSQIDYEITKWQRVSAIRTKIVVLGHNALNSLDVLYKLECVGGLSVMRPFD